jgi:parvulin-like peptidyl-prolyl isomerase
VRSPRCIATYGAAVVVVTSLSACGGGSNDGVVIRVGDTSVTKTTLDHWMSVMAGGRTAAGRSSQSDRVRRRQALELLISLQWLIGQVSDQGQGISEQEIQRRLNDNEKALAPGGAAELHSYLSATGQTIADLELQAKRELAAQTLRQLVREGAGRPTDQQIARYYKQHKRRFAVPEMRETQLTSRKTSAAADELRAKIVSGAIPLSAESHRERFTLSRRLRPPGQRRLFEGEPLENAVRAAKLHVLVGPVHQRVDYFLFKLTRIVPASQRTLAQVKGVIAKQLTAEAQREALLSFVKGWRVKWTGKTDCHPGYVVQKCRQYAGPKVPEDPLSIP